MSWLRSSPMRQSLTRNGSGGGSTHLFSSIVGGGSQQQQQNTSSTILRQRPIDSATDCDPRACYDSFCKHWQQAHEIIQRSESSVNKPPTHDDVLGVVSHLDFMVTLLLVELHHCNKIVLPSSLASSTTDESTAPPAPCLEFMLSENLLDKLYEWGCTTGRYANAVRLEQLKLYELLVSHSRHQLLCHEPFLRPLLKILASSQGEIFPPDLEKRLVILLNQLCVVLMQNVHLLDLFFFTAQTQTQQQSTQTLSKTGSNTTNFIIFSLLIPYVHREGSLGHQARDALLLCMALSQKNSNIGTYIAQYSSMCPLLVTGLGGLYSRLPNSIEITSIDWHRITPDDVTEIPELTLFMNALEFCNAVVQVAHEMIKQQLLDFMYQGFIVPVLGPAILQTLKGKHFQTNIDSQISAMSYLDLILRSVTEPGLLRAFVCFLLDTEKFDGERILDTLVERLSSTDANLCMVAMALFDTLLALHCEDLMLELLLKFLLPGKHVPISYRHKINKIDPYNSCAEYFLELTPDAMKRARELSKHKNIGETVSGTSSVTTTTTLGVHPALPSSTSTMSKTIGANWNYYGLYTGDSLYANMHAYLFEAHWRIAQCQRACAKWANSYKYQKIGNRMNASTHAIELAKRFFNEFTTTSPMHQLHMDNGVNISDNGDKKQLDSLQSLGESSGYESFKWRPVDEDRVATDLNDTTTAVAAASTILDVSDFDNSAYSSISGSVGGNGSRTQTKRDPWRVSSCLRCDLNLTDFDFSEDLFAQGTVSLGPFLNAILAKLQTFTSNTLYVNFHLTGLITRLAWYPLPLVHSLLLRPDIVITSDTPSFHQVLRILKQQIDAELPVIEDSLEIIDVARSSLIDREFRLMNARKANEHSPLHQHSATTNHQQQRSTFANISAATPVQAISTTSYDPFKRNDNKRRSISKSFTSMFSRKSNSNAAPSVSSAAVSSASSGLSQIYAFFTGAASTLTAGNNNNSSSVPTNQSGTAKTNNAAVATHETSLSTPPTATVPIATAAVPSATIERPNYSSSNERTRAETTTIATSTTTQLTNNNKNSSNNHTPQHNSLVSSSGGVSIGNSSTNAYSIHSNSTLLGSGGGGANSEPVSLDSLTSAMGGIASTSGGTERTRDLALCAVLLDEWLKELAAIAQEQSVVLLNENLL